MHTTDSSRISPTAHYTGFVWYRNGLSDPAFRTCAGWLLFHGVQPIMLASRLIGGAVLEDFLLDRHRAIDALLAQDIEAGRVSQVVEIAAGLSPRGYRFMDRYRDRGLVYVEGDLPDMCARKRRLLGDAGLLSHGHHVVEIDALADDGPASLSGLDMLSPDAGTAVITEGLTAYFDRASIEGMWRRFARFLSAYPHGRYLSDLHHEGDVAGLHGHGAFRALLSVFARGQVHVHYADAAATERALSDAGFDRARVRPAREICRELGEPASAPSRPSPVSVIAATTGRA